MPEAINLKQQMAILQPLGIGLSHRVHIPWRMEIETLLQDLIPMHSEDYPTHLEVTREQQDLVQQLWEHIQKPMVTKFSQVATDL